MSLGTILALALNVHTMFNVTFNNISVILCRLVPLVVETEIFRQNH